ncbi:maleylacetoacetate isomerase [Pelistega europaea]|uniref:Maleylacetoacetate isomerase n=1 Tax=Pelistega europaea TaxID=106147 RepID=A0A7Y4P3S8_9BURK|nr:maleylacetoacetate isomerase [Pelistega europaea]NOL48766.1 maleylacetoacetate isomerase [Pelistega europaea]
MKLYSYYRSSAAYRVRIALALKNIPYDIEAVSLVNNGGEHRTEAYAALNPQRLVPSLEDGGKVFGQSLAMLEYLEEKYPEPPLLPTDALGRARVRSIALLIAADTHPLNNMRVLKYLVNQFGFSEEQKLQWYHHWIRESFGALERMLQSPETGLFCHGDTPTLADCCLVPQVYNAYRFNCDISDFPTIVSIAKRCNQLDAFREAAPEQQQDK